MSKDEPSLVVNQLTGLIHKKKNPKTIRVYLSFLKSYLRLCHGVKLTTEDFRDYVEIPTPRKELRKPILLDQLKAIMNNASPQRKALYYLLVTSGMRLGEALTLTKENFHTDENPVRISIEAEHTKTKEARETYVTSEAFEKIKPVLDTKKNEELLFTHIKTIAYAVSHEDRRFADLREKLGFTEKYKSANRYVVTLHAFRAYFHTKASQKLRSEAANALDGHSGYLSQYYRQEPEERANKYLELEPDLLIESVMIESKGRKDQVIKNLEDQFKNFRQK